MTESQIVEMATSGLNNNNNAKCSDAYFIGGGQINPMNSCGDSLGGGFTGKVRHVRYVYCGDGVVEECDEDEEEIRRIEVERREKQLEEEKRLELEAVTYCFVMDIYRINIIFKRLKNNWKKL